MLAADFEMYTLKLNSQPTGDVTITISSDNTKVTYFAINSYLHRHHL